MIGAVAVGVGLIAAIGLALWLPAGLTLREARRRTANHLVLAVGDRSVAAVAAEFRSTDLDRITAPATHVVLEFGDDFVGIWAGGAAAERIATVPASSIEAVTLGFAAFHTSTPVPYLALQLADDLGELRFTITGSQPFGLVSRPRVVALAGRLAERWGVPLNTTPTWPDRVS